MIKVENVDAWGFEHAVRGMRNPMNSWKNSDSGYGCGENHCICCEDWNDECVEKYKFCIGKNDLELMHKLFVAGTEHRKFFRQIFVSMDITAPLYWWKEFDTYKIGTVADSCSTMHTIHKKQFTLDDFSYDQLTEAATDFLSVVIIRLNHYREAYLKAKDKMWWWQMIQLLPESYNQMRTVTMNYENVVSIIPQRENHRLDEWVEFVKVLKQLPYIKEIMENVD